jgi:hypothetical protein
MSHYAIYQSFFHIFKTNIYLLLLIETFGLNTINNFYLQPKQFYLNKCKHDNLKWNKWSETIILKDSSLVLKESNNLDKPFQINEFFDYNNNNDEDNSDNGKGHPHTNESKAKISAANKGKTPWNVGRQHSEETKRKIAEKTREAIIKSGNQYLFTIPYSPTTNAVEMYFNQIKTYIKKNRDVYTFDGLEKNIDKAIDKVKPEHYKNYFQYAYGVKDDNDITYKRKPSTRKCKLKNYKS